MAETRKRLQADDVRQSDYVYLETRHEQKLDETGKTTKETLNVFESYPALPGEFRWQRQTVKDGRPVPPDELAKADRDRQKKVMDYAKRLQREPDKVRAEEQKKRDEERRDTDRAVDDALRVYEIKMLGREIVNGYETIAFSFTPRKNAKPQTREGKIMMLLATVALVLPAIYARVATHPSPDHIEALSLDISYVLIATYAASLLFQFRTHRKLVAPAADDEHQVAAGHRQSDESGTPVEAPWSLTRSLVTLIAAAAAIGLVSEFLVGAVDEAGHLLGLGKVFMSPPMTASTAASKRATSDED